MKEDLVQNHIWSNGRYSYFEISTLILLNKLNEIDIKSFILWLKLRKMIKEGGFNGRTNKLVDSMIVNYYMIN